MINRVRLLKKNQDVKVKQFFKKKSQIKNVDKQEKNDKTKDRLFISECYIPSSYTPSPLSW